MKFNGDLIGVLVFFFLLLFCMGMQAAFMTSNRLNVELKKKQGRSAGVIFSYYYSKPYRLLSSFLLGAIIAIVGYEYFFQKLLKNSLWIPFHIGNSYVVGLINFLVSFVILLVGGIVFPRVIFRNNERLMFFFAPLARTFEKMCHTLVGGIMNVNRFVLVYLFNVKVPDREKISSLNLSKLFNRNRNSAMEAHIVDEENTTLFENVLSLANIKVKQCMVPRTEIIALDKRVSMDKMQAEFVESSLSRLVIYDNSIDDIVGYVNQSDFFRKPTTLEVILVPILKIPETMMVINLMKLFSDEKRSMAWVIDEFGGTAGIITMEDILEEIFGTNSDEEDRNKILEKNLGNGTYLFSGRIELDYLRKKYGFQFPSNDFETLSGYIVNYCKAIPRVNTNIVIDNYAIEILNVADTRINMVKLRPL